MHFATAWILMGFLALSVTAGAAMADCWLFEEKNFGGQSMQIKDNQVASQLGELDNKTSSVKVTPQCILIGYDLPGLAGPPQTWGPGQHPDLPPGWDDVISSAKCSCRPQDEIKP
jgi:hypothetical protein